MKEGCRNSNALSSGRCLAIRLRIVLLVVILGLTAGCSSQRARTDPSSPTPQPGTNDTGFRMNETRGIVFLPFQGGPEVDGLLGFGSDRPTAPQTGHVFATRWDARNKTWHDSPPSFRPGGASRYESYAAANGARAYVAMDVMAAPTGYSVDQSWIDLFSYKDGAWTLEEAPDRWLGLKVKGLAASNHKLFLLGLLGTTWQLWQKVDSSWTNEPLETSLNSLLSVSTNGTHVFVAGPNSAGELVVRVRQENESAWMIVQLQPGSRGARPVSAGVPGSPPTLAWINAGFPADPDDYRPYIAELNGTAWRVASISQDSEVRAAGASARNGMFIMIQSTNANSSPELWLANGAARRCFAADYQTFFLPFLVSTTEAVAFSYTSARRGSAGDQITVFLDPGQENCLAGGIHQLP